MHPILRIPYLTWAALTYIVLMLLFFPVFMLFALMPRRIQCMQANLSQRIWGGIWCFLVGIRIKAEGREKVDRSVTSVIVMNHQSFMDTPAACLTIRHWFKTLAKKSLNKVPVMGWIIALSGVSVDRKSPEARRRSMEKMKREIRSGVSIQIFPEGTQNRTQEPLQPFYAGAFKLAVDMQVPIVPAVILGSKRVMPQAQFGKLRPGVIRVVFLDPLKPQASTEEEVQRLQQLVESRMREVVLARG